MQHDRPGKCSNAWRVFCHDRQVSQEPDYGSAERCVDKIGEYREQTDVTDIRQHFIQERPANQSSRVATAWKKASAQPQPGVPGIALKDDQLSARRQKIVHHIQSVPAIFGIQHIESDHAIKCAAGERAGQRFEIHCLNPRPRQWQCLADFSETSRDNRILAARYLV